MNNLTKEQLEVILRAFKFLENSKVDEKKCLKTIRQEVNDAYLKLVVEGLE